MGAFDRHPGLYHLEIELKKQQLKGVLVSYSVD